MLPLLALRTGCDPSESEEDEEDAESDTHARWLEACGGHLPWFKEWKRVRKGKKTFRELANASENDRFSLGQYVTPYSRYDIDRVLREKTWSIEHVLPRSFVNGRDPGRAEDDVFGWMVATRSGNATRSNLPLVLWELDPSEFWVGVVVLEDGVTYYNPPNESKPVLARKWLYERATYGEIDQLKRPSTAQFDNRSAISAMANSNIGYAEERLHLMLSERAGGWKNPLIERAAAKRAAAVALATQLAFWEQLKEE